MIRNTVRDIRDHFLWLKQNEQYVEDKTGVKMLEIVHASFVADEPAIFGTVNQGYVERELRWYLSESLNVNDIPDAAGRTRFKSTITSIEELDDLPPEPDYKGPPEVWKRCATPDGEINSNYGWMVFSEDNHEQYRHCLGELLDQPCSRRAVMLYNRPSMWLEYDRDGMSDFVCTFAHQYFIRDDKLHVSVTMRSNDVVFGYKNDLAWARWVQGHLARDIGTETGDVYWHAGSLHVYERHFDLVV